VRRWWGIRHIRWLIAAWQLARWVDQCAELGLGMGVPNPSDVRALRDIREGRR
jgi:hypothetical protein